MGIPLYLVDKNKEKLNAHDLIELGRNYKKFWLQLIRDSLQNHLPSSVSTTSIGRPFCVDSRIYATSCGVLAVGRWMLGYISIPMVHAHPLGNILQWKSYTQN